MSAASLADAIEKRLPIKVVRGSDERLVSHVFVAKGGQRLIWGEPNWYSSADTHGVHLVSGTVTGDGPWKAGPYIFIEMEEQDNLQYDHTSMVLLEKEQGEDYKQMVSALSKAFK